MPAENLPNDSQIYDPVLQANSKYDYDIWWIVTKALGFDKLETVHKTCNSISYSEGKVCFSESGCDIPEFEGKIPFPGHWKGFTDQWIRIGTFMVSRSQSYLDGSEGGQVIVGGGLMRPILCLNLWGSFLSRYWILLSL